MRNRKKYRSTVLDLFQSFLAGKINKRQLIHSLTQIDNELKQNRNTLKGLWFKFSKDDTGATTIYDFESGLEKYGYFCPDTFYREQMWFAIDNPKQLQIYFS